MKDNPIIGMDLATEKDITVMAIFVGNTLVDAVYDRLLYGGWQEETMKGIGPDNEWDAIAACIEQIKSSNLLTCPPQRTHNNA